MVVKSVFMLTSFFTPMVILNLGIVTSPLLLFALYLISGLGMAGIGTSVMHDAIHGSYSKHRAVNSLMGCTMNLIGASASVWKVQHNVLHHTYTNINHVDEDINAPFFLRFSPHAKRYWLHRFQHIYAWFFYGLATLSWITSKDFIRMVRFHKMGFFQGKNEFTREIFKVAGWKIFYYAYALVLPIIMIPLPAILIVAAFVAMHFITGLMLSVIFQTAHIMPSIDFPTPDEDGLIANDWTIHQLATTCNYAPRSRLFSWFIGGLNYQVEHHLMPHVCHVHYRKLSHIVARTASEFGLPYHTKRNFLIALRDHARMLHRLGVELMPVNQETAQA